MTLSLDERIWLRARLADDTDLLADALVEIFWQEKEESERGPCGPPAETVSSDHALRQC